ncbi:MAG: hypothetical protein ACLQG3_12330 [Terracidiphilus sp.]
MREKKTMPGAAAIALAAVALLLAAAHIAQAQTLRYLGTITAIAGDTLTVKTDAGDLRTVQVPPSAQLKRIEPGQTDLSKAEPMDFSGLATGDRVLVTLDPNSTGAPPQAARIVAIKQADVTRESDAWNQGVHGLVKSIDPAAGAIVVNTRAGTVTKAVTVTVAKSTVLKRYAPGSVRIDQARPGPIDAIRPGDQLWARGTKSPDGTALAADAVVSGSFRSIAGTVLSTDLSASTIAVKDLATKKPVTVRVSADAQVRRLDDAMAARIAARLKGTQAGSGAHTAANGSANGNSGTLRPFSQSGAGGAGNGDLESILERAPAVQLGSLQKGEAVMIVATEDTSGVNAVKLLAGVEPLLQAPEAQDLLSSWSLNQGESAGGTE